MGTSYSKYEDKKFYVVLHCSMTDGANRKYKEGLNELEYWVDPDRLQNMFCFSEIDPVLLGFHTHYPNSLVCEIKVPDGTRVHKIDSKLGDAPVYCASKVIMSNPLIFKEFVKKHELQHKLIKRSVINLKFIEDQTDELCNEALDIDPCAIEYIKVQKPEFCMKAVKKYPFALRVIRGDYQTENVCLVAVEKDGLSLQYVWNQTDSVCSNAVLNNPCALRFVKNPTNIIYQNAVTKMGQTLKFIDEKNQTDFLCELAVENDGLALKYVFKQNNIICKKAVTNNGIALKYVRDKNYELYKIAVEKNGLALQYVHPLEQTEELCEIAVNNNGLALEFVENQTGIIVSTALNQNSDAKKFANEDFLVKHHITIEDIGMTTAGMVVSRAFKNPSLVSRLRNLNFFPQRRMYSRVAFYNPNFNGVFRTIVRRMKR